MTAEDVPRGEAAPAAPEAPPPDLRLVPAALAGWVGALVGTALPPVTGLVVALAGIAAAAVAAVGCRRSGGRRREPGPPQFSRL